MDGLKGILDSKKALLVTVVLGLYASFVFTGHLTVDQFAGHTMPIILAYFGAETATSMTSIIKGALRKPGEGGEAPPPSAPPASGTPT
jgi:hypothetical protein